MPCLCLPWLSAATQGVSLVPIINPFVKYRNMMIGDLIRARRRDAGLSQRGLAEAIGVNPSAVAHWELGNTVPTNANMGALKRVLGLVADLGISPSAPYTGQIVEDADELALLAFWRSLSPAKRLALTDFLHIGVPKVSQVV